MIEHDSGTTKSHLDPHQQLDVIIRKQKVTETQVRADGAPEHMLHTPECSQSVTFENWIDCTYACTAINDEFQSRLHMGACGDCDF